MLAETFDIADLGAFAEFAPLRGEVRAFLDEQRTRGIWAPVPAWWEAYNPDFSSALGARGWIGMTWPKAYGGGGLSPLARFVVTEELLAGGAPVKAHWQADRQVGPLILRYGSEEQKRDLLPRIAAGELFFCVAMSEPDSGSDLASIRTKATRVDGGWLISGTKVWISFAHRAHMMELFARTSPAPPENRRSGVTQFLVDLRAPGIEIRPIINMAGEHDFNEVVLDGVFIPDSMVLGAVDGGWNQVSDELSYAHSGPERWLSNFGLLAAVIDHLGPEIAAADAEEIGRLTSHIVTLRRISMSIAALAQAGLSMKQEAALAKDLATNFEQELAAVACRLVPEGERATAETVAAMLERAVLYAPSHTIRAGTREILRGIIARGLGLR
ncbi:MAG: acyl-CoA dehydrogenase [Alphaproteobacteria bacterium]|nr:acyl-CoA dehydrogenase [Alphaproteobacteria bacterium]